MLSKTTDWTINVLITLLIVALILLIVTPYVVVSQQDEEIEKKDKEISELKEDNSKMENEMEDMVNPKEIRSEFMYGCHHQANAPREYCECAFKHVMENYTIEQMANLGGPQIQEILNKCK